MYLLQKLASITHCIIRFTLQREDNKGNAMLACCWRKKIAKQTKFHNDVTERKETTTCETGINETVL